MALSPQVQYVGPYSPEAYNAADILQGGGAGTPYTAPIIGAGQSILDAQPTGGTTDPNAAFRAQTAAQVNAAIGRLGGQQAAGNTSLDNSYNSALQQLLQGYNVANRNYNTNKQQTATGYVGAKNTIGSQAGSSLNGLLRLLGSRGAGGSSAYLTSAPQTVARGASLQRADAANTFGQNNQALDTNWGDYNSQYNQQVSGAGQQRDIAKQKLENDIATNKASLLQTLAGLQGSASSAQPYLDQANSVLDKTANYVTPGITYNTPAYQAPTAASYTTNPNPTPQYSGSGPSDYFSPYLQSLLGKKQPQQQFA